MHDFGASRPVRAYVRRRLLQSRTLRHFVASLFRLYPMALSASAERRLRCYLWRSTEQDLLSDLFCACASVAERSGLRHVEADMALLALHALRRPIKDPELAEFFRTQLVLGWPGEPELIELLNCLEYKEHRDKRTISLAIEGPARFPVTQRVDTRRLRRHLKRLQGGVLNRFGLRFLSEEDGRLCRRALFPAVLRQSPSPEERLQIELTHSRIAEAVAAAWSDRPRSERVQALIWGWSEGCDCFEYRHFLARRIADELNAVKSAECGRFEVTNELGWSLAGLIAEQRATALEIV